MLTVNLAARFSLNAILMHFNYRNFFLSMLWKILNSLKTNWNCNQNYRIFAQTLSMLLSRLFISFSLLQYRVELSHVHEFTGHKNVETTVGAVFLFPPQRIENIFELFEINLLRG